MSWSWKLARIAGIDVYIHATFVMLMTWLGLEYWRESHSLRAVAEGVGFMLALFGCVVLHEFGHALTARRFGIRTRNITLLPIGGVAQLERMPDQPSQELLVALAGPAVNVVIGAMLFGWLQVTGAFEGVDAVIAAAPATGLTQGGMVERVMTANVFLAVFNLLPAFPMDGGRVLRALLATRMDRARATRQAAFIGQGMAVLFGFIGLQGNPMLVFIALFVWIGAAQEAGAEQMKSALAGVQVRRAMLTRFHTLAPSSTLGEAADLLLSDSQQDFPVVSDGHVEGILTRTHLISALGREGREATIAAHITRDCPTAETTDMLDGVLARLRGRHCLTMPVLEHGTLIGLVTMENVGEFLMIQAAGKTS